MMQAKSYIFSGYLLGQRIPQRVQNIVVREYATAIGVSVSFPSVEYSFAGSTAILNSLIDTCNIGEMIIFYSITQMPENESNRQDFYEIVNAERLKIHFALESIEMSNKSSFLFVEDLLTIKRFHSLIDHSILSIMDVNTF